MNFNCIEDIKFLINKILECIDKTDVYYNDLNWFSEVNYTTTTEYFGELKIFINKIINYPKFSEFYLDLKQLLNSLEEVLKTGHF